jgi:Helix-turn-helix domain
MSSSEVIPIVSKRPEIEPYVDADVAANFLAVERATLQAKARKGKVPAHPWGEGRRRMWRFRLSELEQWMNDNLNSAPQKTALTRKTGRAKTAA